MVINYLLLIAGTFSLYYGGKFYEIRKKENRICSYILVMSIFCALWCYGYAFMGLTTNLEMAPLYRKLALLGVSGFLSTECLFVMYKAGFSSKKRRRASFILLLYIIGYIVIWGANDVRSFYRVGNRTLYVSGTSNGYYYVPITMTILLVAGIYVYNIWKNKTIYERERRFQRLIFAANIFICFGTIPDTVFPMLGIESFPASPIGAFATMLALFRVCLNYVKYDVSKKSLSNHAYEFEEAGFLAFNMAGRLSVANPYATRELNIRNVNNQRISDIFDIGDIYDTDVINTILQEETASWQFNGKNSQKSYAVSFSIAKDDFGDPYCILCAMHDRTREQELIEDIKASGETKSSFLANMSHEIRTPINAILGMNEMMLRESTDTKVLEYAQSVGMAGEHLLNIVNDILDYSKIQSGMMRLIRVDYDLSEILHSLLLSYSQKAKKKGLDFKIDVDPKVPIYLNGDEVRVTQIIKNILDNAVKYTDEGEISFSLNKKDISEDEVELIFSISDTGKGIKEEDKEQLFGAFVRADYNKNQTIAGTGLGLAIVGNLINMMDGEISADSTYGQGTTFSFSIRQKIVSYHPIGDYEKSLAEYEELTLNGWSGEYTAPAARVLVVDDNHMNLNVAQFLLKRTKIKVDTATSGEEALGLIQKNAYQIIFLDHIMPGMDGVETLKEIKQENLATDVPIICLSANDIAGARQMYTDYGFTDFLPKPISGGSLEKKVYEYLPKSFIHQSDNEAKLVAEEYEVSLELSRFEGEDEIEAAILEGSKRKGNQGELTHVVILNPAAVAPSEMEEIRNELSSMNELRHFVFTTSEVGDETALVQKIQKYFSNERLRIYAVGGSGTVRNVLNGIDDFDRIELAVCPMGLTNDFIKVFGTNARSFKDIRNLIRGEAVPIDYIETTGGRALNTFSLGLDANMCRIFDSARIFKAFGKQIPYIMAFIYSMFLSSPEEYEIYVGDERIEGASAELIFGNGSTLGGSFIFDDNPVVNDGLGRLAIGANAQGFAVLPTVSALLKGNKEKLSKQADLRDVEGFSIRRRDGGQLAMNFDGEMVYGIEKWEAKIIKQGLKFVLPKGVSLNE